MSLSEIHDTADFRDVLFMELQRRKSTTPGYSLRRFAKFLATDPSFLTKLFQKKRNLTAPVLKKFGKRLGMDDGKLAELKLNLYRLNESPKKSRVPSKRLKRVSLPFGDDSLLVQWQFFMILELLTVDDFDATAKNIVSALGTNKKQVDDALVRLEKVKMIKIARDGKISLINANPSTNLHATSGPLGGLSMSAQAIKSMLIQLHLKSISSFKETAPEKRRHLGLFVAMPSSRVPEAKKLMEKFRDRFENIVQRPGKRDSVFYLGTSFFPMYELNPEKSS